MGTTREDRTLHSDDAISIAFERYMEHQYDPPTIYGADGRCIDHQSYECPACDEKFCSDTSDLPF